MHMYTQHAFHNFRTKNKNKKKSIKFEKEKRNKTKNGKKMENHSFDVIFSD